ncbi:hypothetical protein A4X03_0g4785, partial [Tilletia caries]
LVQFLPHHEFDRTTAQLLCGGQTLQAVGKQVIVPGWHQVLAVPEADNADAEAAPRSQVLPALDEGLSCQVDHVDLKALKTQPPNPYTQGDLIKAMKGVAKLVTDPRLKQKLKETTGIGTEATRASIIKGLFERGYLLKKGRAVRASDAACKLIDVVPAAITDPGTTALWEQALDMIEAGDMTLETFVAKQSTWITRLVQQYRVITLAIKLPEGPACPLCGSATRQRTGKTGPFWSCCHYPDCKGTLPVQYGRQTSAKRSTLRKPRQISK